MIFKEKVVKEKTTPYKLMGHGDQIYYHTEKVISKSILGIINWKTVKTETTHNKNCNISYCKWAKK